MQPTVLQAGGSGLTEPPMEAEWTTKEVHDDKVSELPLSPNCPSLIALYLQGNFELTAIPPLFFHRMALLQVLDLSHTSIKSLPKSLPKLVALKKLLLRGCELFMELSAQVGKLKNLEELDLDETQIMDLPREVGKLLKLRHLRVSFYHISGKKKLKPNVLIHPETISNLPQLTELRIDVIPEDKRWDDSVEAVVKEVCNSKALRTLSLYLPRFELLDNISLIYSSLSRFRFTIGHHKRRIISRVPDEVEAEFRNWDKCLKFVNGENIPIEIKGVLKYSTSFFLEHHATAVNLSEFGIDNMKRLKFCLLAECNKMESLIDGEMHYERKEDDRSESDSGSSSVERVLESLEYLSIYYMENLGSIWRGPNHYGCMSKLKFLALHTCPQLSNIFFDTLLGNFVNLEEIILEDCPQVTSLVSNASVKPRMSDEIFLPSLKRLLLLYLPELVSISNGLLIAPKLESIGFYNCPKLTSVSKLELSSKSLKIIKGECQWWEDMNWNETEWETRPDYLMRLFFPINNEKDVMTQLAEVCDLLEQATIQNECQQLDYMGERVTGTGVTKSTPPLCILPSEKNNRPEDDYFDLDSEISEVDVDEDEPKAKRWNCTENENKGVIGSANKATKGDKVAFQTTGNYEIFDDGYKWRKYGKKMVKGTSHPRNYYKCSKRGCPVKKRVERDSQDTSFYITTYNGIHNHDRTNVMGLYNLQSQLCNDRRVNSVEDDAEAAKIISPTEGDAEEAKIISPTKGDAKAAKTISPTKEYAGIPEASKRDESQQSDAKAERMKTNVINIIPSTLPTVSPPAPGLIGPAKLPDHPVLMNTSNVLPSPTTGEYAAQSLIQKSNSGNDQQSISKEDDNSSDACHLPPPSPVSTTSTISQLSATTLPTTQLQAQSFDELAEQNQSKGNLQSQARYDSYYKQYSGLVKRRKSEDGYPWRFYGSKGSRNKYNCAYPGCRAKKSVERSFDGPITEVIQKGWHNHPQSQPNRNSSLSAFSRIIRASNHLTIKIPNLSFVTYEGGEMNGDGSVVFMKSVPVKMLQRPKHGEDGLVKMDFKI